MKSLSDLRKLLLDIRERPDRHFRSPCYEKLCAFLERMEFALICPFMDGLRERIIAAGGQTNPEGCGLLSVLFEDVYDLVWIVAIRILMRAEGCWTGRWIIWTTGPPTGGGGAEVPGRWPANPWRKSGSC